MNTNTEVGQGFLRNYQECLPFSPEESESIFGEYRLHSLSGTNSKFNSRIDRCFIKIKNEASNDDINNLVNNCNPDDHSDVEMGSEAGSDDETDIEKAPASKKSKIG